MADSVLRVENLAVAYRQGAGWLDAVRDFHLQIAAGQTYGLVGESGSGKSTVALAVMRYLRNGRVQSGQIRFQNRDLLTLSPTAMRLVWGRGIGLVPQDPLSALNPALRIGEQLAEGLRLHLGLSKDAAAARAAELLDTVRVPDPARVAASYPHQISGGMQQRVMIAMALSTEPPLLILDEPTTNLDVTTQAAVLDLFRDLIAQRHTAVLYVTHNLGVVARICDRVAVLYAGELVEDASTNDLYRQPLHPYTRGLLDSVPQLGQNKAQVQLQAIPGQIPSLGNRPSGCVFAPRCPLAVEKCHAERPLLEEARPDQSVRCHRWRDVAAGAMADGGTAPNPQRSTANTQSPTASLLTVKDLKVHFRRGRGQRPVRAVDGVSLATRQGQTLGLVGESGSGKTTLARAIIGLTPPTSGEMTLRQTPLPPTVAARSQEVLRHLQYVFQNPEEALNPYMTVGETLARPFLTLQKLSRQAAQREAHKLLTAVSLSADYAQRFPHQLSGGEKQRVAIARAFAAHPDLLIADEAVSALDVSVQASILNLLNDLQAEHGNALLFISHDLAVVGYLADTIAVMYLGQIMEIAAAADLFTPPQHPYTTALLSAIPVADPQVEQEHIRLEGDVPSQTSELTGCPFHPRCPRYLGDICRTKTPPWQELPGGKQIFCHITTWEDLPDA